MRRKVSRRLCLAFAGVLAAAPLAAVAAPAPPAKSVYGGPQADWTGVWVVPGSFLDLQDGTSVSAPSGRDDPGISVIFALGRPKLKPEPAKAAAESQAAEAAGRPIADPATACMPSGVPGFWNGPYAWEIVQARDQINLGQEYLRQVRRVYMDGRKHPNLDEADPLLLGHSIGHWEGDVLVVETANFSPTGRISGPLTNPNEATRVVEKFRPVGPDRLDVEVTVTSPNVLEEPWSFVRKLKRKPGLEILDFFCEENERNPIGADGVTQSILPPQTQ